jgi:aromatase
MAELRIRTARHTVRVAAPPRRVYQLIADVGSWPEMFDPIVAVDPVGLDGARETSERVRVWELVDNEVLSCVSHREYHPTRMQVRFRQEGAAHPLVSMGGLWLVVPKGRGSLVALDHYYRVANDNPADVRWLADAIDHNSTAMLSALRETAEQDGELDQLWLSYEDSVDVDGDPRDVYDFLARVQDWPQRIPHVDRLLVDEDVSDIQRVQSEVRLPNGSVHATNLIRLCFPETRIVFKHTKPPATMRAHTGTFAVTRLAHTVRVTAAYRVRLRREALPDESTVDDMRAAVRQVLHEMSKATLGRAKAFAESRRRPMRASAA